MLILTFSVSLIIFALSVVSALFSKKIKFLSNKAKPLYILLGGTVLSIFVFMLYVDFKPCVHGAYATFFLSLFHTIQVLLLGYDFEFIECVISIREYPAPLIYAYLSFLFFLAPILTFSVVLSFFKNVTATVKYLLNYNSDIYLLSELSEKSVILANSIREKFPQALIVFANTKADSALQQELSVHPASIGAICFSRTISDFSLKHHNKSTKAVFFAINENETVNLEASLKIINTFSQRSNYELYVFSRLKEGELLLDSIDCGAMKVRRINEDKTLTYLILEKYPITDYFIQEGDTKVISALIVGFGGYGSELAKGLLWCSQLPGYRLDLKIIEQDMTAESRFRAECPEIFLNNGNRTVGDAIYDIEFIRPGNILCNLRGINVHENEFTDTISKLENTSLVFVSLGNDELNIETAIALRIMFERIGKNPAIKAIVHSDIKYSMLKEHPLADHKNKSYEIELIGNTSVRFAYDTIVNEDLEARALKCHLGWVQEVSKIEEYTATFNAREYYRNSSIASAIHTSYRDKKTPEPVSKMYEHMRWCAYMRTEGFIFSGSVDKGSRNDRAKTHNNLTTYENLPENIKNKDAVMINANQTP